MAAAPPPRDRDGSLNNDGAGHGHGKFRKQPFRRATKTTPYDRPPSAVRNPASGSLQSQGWLSKLVHPAQRLIPSSTFQLFGSVFRKRLPPPPPPQPPEPELSLGNMEKQPPELGSAGLLGKQAEDINETGNPSNSSSSGGVSEVELILKQKTFTRSEIDHLTAILLSRMPGGGEEKRLELFHSRAAMPQDHKEFPNTSLGDNRVERNLDSTPSSDSRVLDEDVASPAELAKAYMGQRSLMGSPSKQGFPIQPLRDNSTALMNHPFTARSPMASFVPSSSGRAVFAENGFVTPRSQGRTAIYSMVRTPYSRVLSASGLQNSGASVDALGELPSSSQNSWENNRFSGSKQGALKRRSSVLDSDSGSVGPIRRIRQKSNLLPSSKNFSVRRDGFVSYAAQHPSSVEKSFLVSEPSKGNGGNNINGSGVNPVPSKSREVAAKILQQLDVLVSSREKSPAKLSPSVLSGPALRSLENADSSKFMENLDVKHGNLLPDPRGIQPQEPDKMEQNGQEKPFASFDKSAASIHGVDSTNLVKKAMPGLKATVAPVTDTVSQSSLHKSRGFQMSAREDFLELDGDDNSQENLPTINSGRREKHETVLVENGTTSMDAVGLEKPPAFPESIITAKSDGPIVPGTSPSTTADQQAVTESRSKMLSVKATLPEKSDTSPAFAEKVIPAKALNCASAIPNSCNSVGNEAPLLKFSSSLAENDLAGLKAWGWSDSIPGGLSGTTDSAGKEVELEKDDNKDTMKARVLGRLPEPALSAVVTSSSTANIFSFGIATSLNQNSGSIASTSISFSSPPLASNNVNRNSSNISSGTLAASISDVIAITSSASNANSSGSLSTSVPAPFFKFGSSVVPLTSVSSGLATSMTGSTEAGTKKASFGVGTSSAVTSMGVTNSMFMSTGGNLFAGTSAITSTGAASSTIASTRGNLFGGSSAFTNTGINSFSSVPSAVTSIRSSTIDSMPSAVSSMESSGSVAIMSSGISTVSGASSAVTSAPSSIFGFNSGVTVTATANQSQGFNPFGAGSVPTSSTASNQSMPLQLSSSAPSPSHTSAGNATFSLGSSVPNSSTSAALFSSNATFGVTSSSSSASDSISSSNSATPIFGSSWQGPKSLPLSSPTVSSSSSSLSAAFSFGASTSANSASTSTHGLFGSSFNPSSSASPFSFSSPATITQTQPVFGNLDPSFGFGSSCYNNSDLITMEDSVTEDPMQSSSPPVPIFGQQSASPGFTFGLTAPLAGNQFGSTALPAANQFQFSGQPIPVAPQNQSPFQASGSFNAGGSSFSLGAGGEDKSQRRIFKAKRFPRKK